MMTEEGRWLNQDDTFLIGGASGRSAGTMLTGVSALQGLASQESDGDASYVEAPEYPALALVDLEVHLSQGPLSKEARQAVLRLGQLPVGSADQRLTEHVLRAVYVAGKDSAYSKTGYRQAKLERLQKQDSSGKAVSREALFFSSDEDHLAFQQLLMTWLEKSRRTDLVQADLHAWAINSFALAQLIGYQEQGILKVQFSCPIVRDAQPICRSRWGQQFEVADLLHQGGCYPMSRLSHPLCRCTMNPVISYVTLQGYVDAGGSQYPGKFIKGTPLFDDKKLQLKQVMKSVLVCVHTTFFQVPSEHVPGIQRVEDWISKSLYKDILPTRAKFVQDVYEDDAYQLRGNPTTNLAGKICTWVDETEDVLAISAYVAEYEPIEGMLLRAWASRIWAKTPQIRQSWHKHGHEGSLTAPTLDTWTMETLQAVHDPYPLVEAYYTGGVEAWGFSSSALKAPWGALQEALITAGLDAGLAKSLLECRRQSPLWEIDGHPLGWPGVQHQDQTDSVEDVFTEAVVAYVLASRSLLLQDPQGYALVRDHLFSGVEF